MINYRMEINSGSLPELSLDFTMASDDMATDYAYRISKELAGTKWGHFILWEISHQERIAEWTIKTAATILPM